MKVTIQLDIKPVINKMNEIEKDFDTSLTTSKINLLMDIASKQIESWAKDNAPWTDRTGDARKRLQALTYSEQRNVITIAISHHVNYGIWLELANQRKYAILEKALLQNKAEIVRALKNLLE